jgi:hypothetical protein
MGRVSRPTRHLAAEGPGAAARRDPRNPWAPTAFARLARAHAAGIAGDASFAIGLAGSVFFSLDFDSARWRVLLYLVLTIAPFAVAAPLIGPALDRIKGGRRWIIVGSMGFRAVLAFLVVRHLDSLLFYPEAFGMLVLGKVYTISKSAVVPGTVRTDTELIEANSKLTVLSAVVTVLAAAPAGALLGLGGAQWTVGFSAVMFVVATVFAFRLAPTTVAEEPAGQAEKEELRSAGIFLAGGAMALVRGVVGFLSFLLAFAFKNDGAQLWQLGVVAATAQVGFFIGAVVAPHLRRLAAAGGNHVGAGGVTTPRGFGAAVLGGILGSAILSMLVGATGGVAKQAFDAILQRDAPDANRGRSFARFETRFQLVWVIGAIVPIVVPIPAPPGFVVIGVATGITAVWYVVGQRRILAGKVPVRRRGWRVRPIFGPGLRSRHPLTPSPAEGTEAAAGTEAAGGAAGDPTLVAAPIGPDDYAVVAVPEPPGPPGGEDLTGADPTLVDPTLVDAGRLAAPAAVAPAAPAPAAPPPGDAPPDAARRWMRRSTAAATPPTPDPAPVEGQGLLFGPEAWADLPRPADMGTPDAQGTTPPDDPSPGDRTTVTEDEPSV